MGSNDGQTSHEKSLLLFRVGPFKFCVPATDVEAIIGMPASRSLPNAPPSIQGVFSHRGQVATVINLRRKFGLDDHRNDTDGQLVLARISIGLTGFRADEVMDITTSMEKDIIEITALKESTRFDQVVILGDQVIQCTEFELLYQAEDAPYRPGPESATDEPSDDALPIAEEDSPKPDGGTPHTSPPTPDGTDRSDGEPEEKNPPDTAAETTSKAPTGPLKLSGAGSFTHKNKAYASHKASPQRPLRQFQHPAGRKPAAREKWTGSTSSGRLASRPPEESMAGEPVGWAPPEKRSGIPFGWILLIAAALIALYIFWPKSEEERQPRSTSDGSIAPAARPATSITDNARQNVTRASSPSSSSRAVEDTAASTGPEKTWDAPPAGAPEEKPETYTEPLGDDTPPVSGPNESAALEEPGTGEKTEIGSAPAEVKALETTEEPVESMEPATGSTPAEAYLSEAAEKHGEIEEPEVGNTPAPSPGPIEESSRFMTIQTEDFTLSVEPGTSESGEPSSQSQPAPAPSAETEYVHIVVKGDTLWDIAEEYLGDPFQYPQLAELSRIRDPDWIYPGDRVRIIVKGTSEQDQ